MTNEQIKRLLLKGERKKSASIIVYAITGVTMKGDMALEVLRTALRQASKEIQIESN